MRKDFIKGQLQKNSWLLKGEQPRFEVRDFYRSGEHVGIILGDGSYGQCLCCDAVSFLDDFIRAHIDAALVDESSFKTCAMCETQLDPSRHPDVLPVKIDGDSTRAVVIVCPVCATRNRTAFLRSVEYID